jgi:hypothetical protein
MEEIRYNIDGFNKHMSYDRYLYLLRACKFKAGIDRLDGVSHLRKVNEPVRAYAEANWADTVPNLEAFRIRMQTKNTTEMHKRPRGVSRNRPKLSSKSMRLDLEMLPQLMSNKRF